MAMLTEIHINGTSVRSYLKHWNTELTFGESIGDINIKLVKSVYNALDLENGQVVEIWRGLTTATDKKVFYGYIEKIKKGSPIIEVYAKDRFSLAKRGEKTYSYDEAIDDEAGVGSLIWTDLMSPYAFATSVVSTGTDNTLSKFICNHADPYERGLELCKDYDYQQFYKADTDTAYFQPKGYTNSAIILRVGTNIVGIPKWSYNFTQCQNYVTVIGGEQHVETTVNFVGDASTTEFALSNTPLSVKVYVDSVLQVGGAEDATEGTYDYTVDKEYKIIKFVTAPNGDTDIEIRYMYPLTIAATGKDSASISKYCEGDDDKAYKKTYFKTEIVTAWDAQQFVDRMIKKFGTPFVDTTLPVTSDTNTLTLAPGQTIRVVDNVNNEDRFVLITKIKMSWPHKFDEVEVGDKVWRTADWQFNVLDRLRRIEEEMGKNQEVLINTFALDRIANYNRRYFKLCKNTVGNPQVITQGQMIYKEFLYDDDFINASSSATLNTTTKEVEF